VNSEQLIIHYYGNIIDINGNETNSIRHIWNILSYILLTYMEYPHLILPIGSMGLLYMVTWIPSIYPSHVSIYTSTMDPMG
jgi:hypothetical protein